MCGRWWWHRPDIRISRHSFLIHFFAVWRYAIAHCGEIWTCWRSKDSFVGFVQPQLAEQGKKKDQTHCEFKKVFCCCWVIFFCGLWSTYIFFKDIRKCGHYKSLAFSTSLQMQTFPKIGCISSPASAQRLEISRFLGLWAWILPLRRKKSCWC